MKNTFATSMLAAAAAVAPFLCSGQDRQPAASEATLGSYESAVGELNAAGSGPELPDGVRETVRKLADKVRDSLASSSIPSGRTITVLPLAGDVDGYVRERIQTAVTEAGKSYVVGELDPALRIIAAELAVDTRRADIYDPATVKKLLDSPTTLKSPQILVYGVVRVEKTAGRAVFGSLVLHALDKGSGEQVWSRAFGVRHYVPGDRFYRGLTAIAPHYREAMRGALLAKAVESFAKSGGLGGARRISFLPLAADDDGYLTQIVNEALVSGGFSPVNDGLETPADALAQLDDDNRPGRADALLYGSVRGIGEIAFGAIEDQPWKPAVEVEIQLDVVKAGTHELLYAGTLAVRIPKPSTWWDGIGQRIGYYVPFLAGGRLWYLAGAVVAFLALVAVVRAMTRAR